MCRVLGVSRSGYYRWVNPQPSAREVANGELLAEIQQLYHQSQGRYGSPKITKKLHAMGYSVSRQRVARLMRRAQLTSIIHKKYRVVTTDSTHGYPVSENLLARAFEVAAPSTVWVSDISYIPTQTGWVYLSIIMDLFDRRIVGGSLSATMSVSQTTAKAWQMALTHRVAQPGMIFHSDRGVQYAAQEFRDLLEENAIVQRMSRKGNCWDNAVAESFFKILKSELIYHTEFASMAEARVALFECIEIWYHRQRIHPFSLRISKSRSFLSNLSSCCLIDSGVN